MWKVVAAAALTLVPQGAGAAQPIKESLVECAVLVEALLGPDTATLGNSDEARFWTDFAAVLRTEAVRQGGQAYVDQMAAEKRLTWESRWTEGAWDNPANRGELAEWMEYCGSLADHLQL